jgi:hypothetical protein
MASHDQYSYARQKFFEALDALVGDGDLATRLTFAAVPLMVLNSAQGDLPEGLTKRFDKLLQDLTATPLSDNAKYIPRELEPDAATRTAHEILSVFVQLAGGL